MWHGERANGLCCGIEINQLETVKASILCIPEALLPKQFDAQPTISQEHNAPLLSRENESVDAWTGGFVTHQLLLFHDTPWLYKRSLDLHPWFSGLGIENQSLFEGAIVTSRHIQPKREVTVSVPTLSPSQSLHPYPATAIRAWEFCA